MKRRLLNAVSDLSGYTHRRWSRRPDGLYCFNFHRVGNDDRSAFHPNPFDLRRLPVQGNPTVDELRREIAMAHGV